MVPARRTVTDNADDLRHPSFDLGLHGQCSCPAGTSKTFKWPSQHQKDIGALDALQPLLDRIVSDVRLLLLRVFPGLTITTFTPPPTAAIDGAEARRAWGGADIVVGVHGDTAVEQGDCPHGGEGPSGRETEGHHWPYVTMITIVSRPWFVAYFCHTQK